MKLSIQLSLLFLLIFQVSRAQEGFRIGPTAAYIFSKPNQTDSVPNQFNFRYKSGFNGGVSMYYGFNNRFGLSAGVLYTSKGYKVYNDSNKNGNNLKNNQSFIEVPIYAVFKQRFNSVSFIRENVGITFASLISKTISEKSNDNGTFRIKEETKTSFYPMLHLGIEVGNENKVGNVFVFGVNYRHSFSNNTNLGIFNSKNATQPYFNLGFKGSYIGVSLTYQFNLKNLKKEEEFFY